MQVNDELNKILSEIDGRTGVYARALHAECAPIEIRADESFALASVVKLPIMVHLLRKVDSGKLDLNKRVVLHEEDRIPGSGVLKDMSVGLQPTIHDLILTMMIISDNTATDKLFKLTSKSGVEEEMHDLGYSSFHVPQTIREMLYSCTTLGSDANFEKVEVLFKQPDREQPEDPDGSSSERGDRATPKDMAQLLIDLYEGRLLSSGLTELALKILKGCRYDDRIPGNLPKGTLVAHKTGTLHGRTNDAGIVFGPKGPYIIVLFNDGEEKTKRASQALAEASSAIYAFLSGT